jgi:hypothetical protein
MNFRNGYTAITTIGKVNHLVIASKSKTPVYGLWKWPVSSAAAMIAWLKANDIKGFTPKNSSQRQFNATFPEHPQAIAAARDSFVAKLQAGKAKKLNSRYAPSKRVPKVNTKAKLPTAGVPKTLLKAVKLGLCDMEGNFLS